MSLVQKIGGPKFSGQHYIILAKNVCKDHQERGNGFGKRGLLVFYTPILNREGSTQTAGLMRAIGDVPGHWRQEYCVPKECFGNPGLRSETGLPHDYQYKRLMKVAYAVNKKILYQFSSIQAPDAFKGQLFKKPERKSLPAPTDLDMGRLMGLKEGERSILTLNKNVYCVEMKDGQLHVSERFKLANHEVLCDIAWELKGLVDEIIQHDLEQYRLVDVNQYLKALKNQQAKF